MINIVNTYIWEKEPQNKAFMAIQKAIQLVYVLVRDINEAQLSLRAMSLVYTTLLSFVPLLALSFSVLKAFGVHNQIKPFLQSILLPLGDKGTEISGTIILFVENMKVGVLGAVGLGVLIYTVISLIHKIESAFNSIWQIKKSRPVAQRFSGYLSVIIISPVLAFSAIGLTGAVAEGSIIQALMGIDAIGATLSIVGSFPPTAFTALIFMMIYILIPNTHVRIIPALLAGLATTVLWQFAGELFSMFNTSGTGSYEAIYSGFAIIIVFMIWLYLNWLIILLGGSLNFYLQNPETIQKEAKILTAGHVMQRLSDCLFVFDYLKKATNSNSQKRPTASKSIASSLKMSEPRIHQALDTLKSANISITDEDDTSALLITDEKEVYKVLKNALLIPHPWSNLHPSVQNFVEKDVK